MINLYICKKEKTIIEIETPKAVLSKEGRKRKRKKSLQVQNQDSGIAELRCQQFYQDISSIKTEQRIYLLQAFSCCCFSATAAHCGSLYHSGRPRSVDNSHAIRSPCVESDKLVIWNQLGRFAFFLSGSLLFKHWPRWINPNIYTKKKHHVNWF